MMMVDRNKQGDTRNRINGKKQGWKKKNIFKKDHIYIYIYMKKI